MAGIASQVARGMRAGQTKEEAWQSVGGVTGDLVKKAQFMQAKSQPAPTTNGTGRGFGGLFNRRKAGRQQGTIENTGERISSIESRLDALEGSGGQDVTQPSPTVSPAPAAGGEIGDLGNVVGTSINDAAPPAAQVVAQDMMGEEFLRNAAVGAAKMIEGKKINK